MKRLGVALAAALASIAPSASAVEGPGDTQAMPCRPTIACTADIVPPGAFELEAGVIYRSLAGRVREVATPFLAKLTMTRWLQLQAGSSGYTSESGAISESYLDDIALGAKLHLVDQWSYRPSVSVSTALSFPTGAETGYPHADDLAFIAYVTKDFGPLHADLNAGLTRFDVLGDPASQGWVALALSTSLPARFGAMIENYYFTPAGASASRDAGGLVALNYNPVTWLVFDAGGDIGYVTATRNFSLFAGITVVPVLLWKSQ